MSQSAKLNEPVGQRPAIAPTVNAGVTGLDCR